MHFSEFGREGLIIQGKGDGRGETGGEGEGEGGIQKHKSRHLYHAIAPLSL